MSDSDKAALMKEKNDLIRKMVEMQTKFAELEHQDGISPKTYYVPESGTFIEEYRREYEEMARRVNKLAHEIKGSGHIH